MFIHSGAPPYLLPLKDQRRSEHQPSHTSEKEKEKLTRLGCGYSVTVDALPINLSLPVELVEDVLALRSFRNTPPSFSPAIIALPIVAEGNSLVLSSINLESLVSLAPDPIRDMLWAGPLVLALRTPPWPIPELPVLPVDEEAELRRRLA